MNDSQNIKEDKGKTSVPTIITETGQLLVPIEVDALFLTEEEVKKSKFAKAAADFSKMPYIYNNKRYNADKANVSEEIVTKPFEDTQALEAGVHLYWQLPQFLTHGYLPSGSDAHFYPTVPDFWLVTRFLPNDPNSKYKKNWVVKSSVHGPNGDGITILTNETSEIPFAYIGKKIELESAALFAQDDIYPLTTLGYGDPTFSAVYTNCRNVFGMHDDLSDIPNPKEINLAYHICGWYDRSENDVFSLDQTQNALNDSKRLIRMAGAEYPFFVFEEIKKQMLDKAGVDKEYKTQLNLFCSGGITNIGYEKANKQVVNDFEDMQIFVGNTVEEAIACLLARQKNKIPDPELEKLFNAFQLGLIQKSDQIDGAKVIDEILHNNRFVAESGERIWVIREKEETINNLPTDKQETQPVILSENSSALLEELNKKEQEVQYLESKLESLRFQVFCDWYKFMIIHYSDDVVEVGQTPDDDELRSFILYKISRVKKIEKDIEGLHNIIAKTRTDIENILPAENLSRCELKQILGPRFWKPKEPVVLFFSDKFNGFKQSLEPVSLSLPPMDNVLARFASVVSFLKILNNDIFLKINKFNQFTGNDFRKPLLMDWEATCYISPRNRKEGDEFYDSDLIADDYELNEFHSELEPKEGKRYIHYFIHSGTTIMSDSGGGNLKSQLESLNLKIDKDDSFFDKIYAQSIGGFNDELLMFKATAQLPVSDPMAETAYLRQFTKAIAEVVGSNNIKAPQPLNHFSPIREGEMKFTRVRFTDHFGQVVELPILAENVFVSGALVSSSDSDRFYLPPRIVQSSRLHFRWCSAKDKTVEAMAGSVNGPVLGWVLHDKFDNTLTFYHPTGEMLCELSEKDGKIRLDGSTGRKSTYGQSQSAILAEAHEQLSGMILKILEDGESPMFHFSNGKTTKGEPQTYFKLLIEQIDRALASINPSTGDNSNISAFFGKPLAIVRASLDFQLKEYPAANYNWDKISSFLKWDQIQLVSTMDNETLDRKLSDGFCDVKLPVKLGDYNRQNDSLVLYFREKSGSTDFSSFYSNNENSCFSLNSNLREDYNIYISVNSPVEYLTMLMYPVGQVHAVTGILPVKTVDLPSVYYRDFLRNFEISFRIGPILTNRLDEARFATFKPSVQPNELVVFKNNASQVLNYLSAKQFTNTIDMVRYIESMDKLLLGKFTPLLLPRSLYLAQSMDDAQYILNEAIDSIRKMSVYFENLISEGVSPLISFAKLVNPEKALQMENVAKAHFPMQKVAYLLSLFEWKGCKAKYFEKKKEEIAPEIGKLVEDKILDIPFASLEEAQKQLEKLLAGKDDAADLVKMIVECGQEPEAEMYVPAPKPESSVWFFVTASEKQVDEFYLKDDNNSEQFDNNRVAALDGWLLLKNKPLTN